MDTKTHCHKELIQTIKKVEGLEADNFEVYSVKTLVDFLKTSNQRFFNQSIPKIEQNFLLLIKLFPESNKLQIIFNLFFKFEIEFKQHIEIEEKTLFPYIKTLYQSSISESLALVLLILFGK
jgi:hemerythrin-like domain-containing protein